MFSVQWVVMINISMKLFTYIFTVSHVLQVRTVFVRTTATLEYFGKSEQNTLDTYQYVHCNEDT